MKRYLIYFTFLLSCLVIGSCNEDIINDPVQIDQGIPPIIEVIGSLAGTVLSENDELMEGVEVFVGSESTVTNKDGVFSFVDITMNENGSVVTFLKSGFFPNYKIINAEQGVKVFANAVMITKELSGTFVGDEGGLVNIRDGGSLVFGPDVIADADGNTFSGEVMLYSKLIDPTKVEQLYQMPGDLRALNENQALNQLVTYAMAAVELESSTGEKLNIKEGETATITLPHLSSSLAPSELPLWYFDESTGYWVEEGMLSFDGNVYTGEVSHFSFWNGDDGFDLVNFKMRFVDQIGEPLERMAVEIFVGSLNLTAWQTTNSNGVVSGFIPANEDLIIRLYTPQYPSSCDLPNFEILFPATNLDVDEERIIDYFEANNLFVTVEDCMGNPLPNAYVVLTAQNTVAQFFSDDFGNIKIPLSDCIESMSDFTLTAVDFETGFHSNPLTLVNDYTQDTSLDPIKACNQSETYVEFELDGVSYVEDFCESNIFEEGPDNWIYRFGTRVGQESEDSLSIDHYFLLGVYDDGNLLELNGEYLLSTVRIDTDRWDNQLKQIYRCDPNFNCGIGVTMTSIPDALSPYYEGEFDGEIINTQTNEIVSLTGKFKSF